MKKGTDTGARDCVCDRCGTRAHAIPETRHRRCGGKNAPIRDKEAKLEVGKRGTWA